MKNKWIQNQYLILRNGLLTRFPNEEMLVDLFPVNEVKRILALHVGSKEDKVIWAYTNNGYYTVKSGYWLVANKEAQRARSEVDKQRIALKKRAWKLATLPKIRMFIWRVLSGALAVADRLNSRGLNIPATCLLCTTADESINHVLFLCDVAGDIWRASSIPLPPLGFSQSLESNVEWLLDLLDTKGASSNAVKSLPWMLWGIWKNRNTILYAATQETTSSIVQRAEEETHIWLEVNKEPGDVDARRINRGQKDRWCPPLLEFVKCNVHANWRNSSLHSGVAWIARDSNGQVKFHAREALTKSESRLVAELRCIIWVLQSVRDLHFEKVCISSDLKDAIAAIISPNLWPRYRHLLEEIQYLALSFTEVVFEEERVETNLIARDIAKSVLRYGHFQSYLALGGPAWLHERLSREEMRSREANEV